MPEAPLRVGILGAARVATFAMIAPAKEVDGVEITAIAARDPQRAKAFASTHAIPSVHDTYRGVMEDPDIDLVYVATPPVNHAELAIAALRASKPVFIEKPVAMNAEQARAIRQASEEAGLPALEAFHWRHHALIARALALLPSLGPLRRIEARFDATIARTEQEFRWNAALGGGALMDLGCYCIHWIRTFSASEPEVISARMDLENGVDVTTEARLRCAGDVEAALHTSMRAQRRAELRIEGASGSITIENPLAPQLGHRLVLQINGHDTVETLDTEPTFTAQLRAVKAFLQEGAPFPLASEDPELNMTVLDAIRAKAW